jgi:periplasmic protein TonB
MKFFNPHIIHRPLDPHRASSFIFASCLALSALVTASFLTFPIRERIVAGGIPETPPVIIQLRTIPEPRREARIAAPAKPSAPRALPIPAKNVPPDTLTIPNTGLEKNYTPAAPPAPAGGTAEASPATAQPAEDRNVYQAADVEEKPKRLTTVTPDYPEMARRAGIEGVVMLKLLVNREGQVDSVDTVKGPDIFRKSSIDAAKRTRFSPARQNNRPVACWVLVPFRFVINPGR